MRKIWRSRKSSVIIGTALLRRQVMDFLWKSTTNYNRYCAVAQADHGFPLEIHDRLYFTLRCAVFSFRKLETRIIQNNNIIIVLKRGNCNETHK